MDDHGRSRPTQPTPYVLDTNVPIHDPKTLLDFPENRVAVPMT
ncbi:PIN domain-containing protein, partial [Pseudomonas aeruginosa]